eukprot:141573-Chlamydomonas_euryale.AAC.2
MIHFDPPNCYALDLHCRAQKLVPLICPHLHLPTATHSLPCQQEVQDEQVAWHAAGQPAAAGGARGCGCRWRSRCGLKAASPSKVPHPDPHTPSRFSRLFIDRIKRTPPHTHTRAIHACMLIGWYLAWVVPLQRCTSHRMRRPTHLLHPRAGLLMQHGWGLGAVHARGSSALAFCPRLLLGHAQSCLPRVSMPVWLPGAQPVCC